MLVESRSESRARDPLIVWLNGGPGCSSMLGAYTELGPYNYVYDPEGEIFDEQVMLEYNHFAWNNKANVMFVD